MVDGLYLGILWLVAQLKNYFNDVFTCLCNVGCYVFRIQLAGFACRDSGELEYQDLLGLPIR